MTGFSFIVLSVLLFLFSVYLGFQIGCWAGDQAVTSRDYWKMNIAAVVIGVVGSVIISPLPLLYSAVIGLLAGCIVGMKMAFGESTGPWHFLDRALNINRSHRETAKRGTGDARRARKKTGEKAPDLISVEGDKKDSR
ncbi:hypothetical protein [Collinsella tanakaei]|uniref:hypothetical protein n=1 Tax=Collinsella tanakaei TaxID=626935 RepID=UPI0039F6291E